MINSNFLKIFMVLKSLKGIPEETIRKVLHAA